MNDLAKSKHEAKNRNNVLKRQQECQEQRPTDLAHDSSHSNKNNVKTSSPANSS